MIQYKENPFYLSETDIEWVESTYRKMSLKERIGQLFCLAGNSVNEMLGMVDNYHIGGVLTRPGKGKELQEYHCSLQNKSKIPLLIAANLETGGAGVAQEGTYYGKEMLVAATNNEERAYQLGKISCIEGAAVGINWSFAPVADIDINFSNPITNTRTFGDNPKRAGKMCMQYLKAAKEENMAATIKHFPGDGVDNRDQHLVTSVNSLSCEEWDLVFGELYKTLTDYGVMTIMAGHIALPAYEQEFDKVPCKKVIPATLSKNLLQKLLREKIGFNGLVCTDASTMIGYMCSLKRELAIPLAIEAGCDMLLFSVDIKQDYEFMLEGYRKELLSEQRLEEAVKRILCVKAAIKLHDKQGFGTLVPDEKVLDRLNCKLHKLWAEECADEGITLVKDTMDLIPICMAKEKRILLFILGEASSNDMVENSFFSCLEENGFKVFLYRQECKKKVKVDWQSIESIKNHYDLLLYVSNVGNGNYQTNSRLVWNIPFDHEVLIPIPWFSKEIPTIFVSVGNPYHLLDVPMISTYINCYCNSQYVINAVVGKLVGKSKFKGISPADVFCGKWDTKL